MLFFIKGGGRVFWKNVEIIREHVAAFCTPVWIFLAVASLGTWLLTVPVIGSDFTYLKILKENVFSDLISQFLSPK